MFCVGCGQGNPAGVPELYPTTVVVVKSGTPVVANANVMLIPDTAASGDWSVSGKADATGGGYKDYITKIPEIKEPDPNLPNEEYALERQKRVEAAGNEIPPRVLFRRDLRFDDIPSRLKRARTKRSTSTARNN